MCFETRKTSRRLNVSDTVARINGFRGNWNIINEWHKKAQSLERLCESNRPFVLNDVLIGWNLC